MPNKSNLREEESILAHSLGTRSTVEGRRGGRKIRQLLVTLHLQSGWRKS